MLVAPSAQPRQAEHALGDDVLEDLGGAALDRVAAGAQQLVRPRRRPRSAPRRRAGRRRAGSAAGWSPTTSTWSATPPGRAGRTSRSRSARGRRSAAAPRRGRAARRACRRPPDRRAGRGRPASAISRSSSWRRRTWRKKARPARSFMSVVSATFQPLPTPPTTLSSGIRASSRNSSLNSDSPVIWRSGTTWTPSCSMSSRKYVSPLCLGRLGVGARDEHAPLGVLGAAGPHLLAGDDPVVAVLDRARLQRREVRAGVGLGEALAPDLARRRGSRQVALLLRVGAPHHHRRPGQQQAEHVGRQRRAGAAELLEEDRRLGQRRAAAAVLGAASARRPSRRRRAGAASRARQA